MTLIRLRPVIENLITAQRALTRAVTKNDSASRETALEERDRCAKAIDETYLALELAHALAVQEQKRIAAREENLQHILALLSHRDPAGVGAVLAEAHVKLDTDQRLNEAFLSSLGEAIEDGFAVRRGNEVRITFAGVRELIAAKRIRFDLESERTRTFRLERELRATTKPSLSTTTTEPRKAAVGA